MKLFILILCMAFVTFLLRAIFFIQAQRLHISPLVQEILYFVPITALAAIITPMIIAPNGGNVQINWQNPQLIGACFASIAYFCTKKPLIVIITGLASFVTWHLFVIQ